MQRELARGIVASLFLVSIASVGVVVTVAPAGAGTNGDQPNCREEHENNNTDGVVGDATTSFMKKGRHCATLEVTKVVTGTPQASPPPGTQFTVHVSCVKVEDETDALQFDGFDNLPIGEKPPIEKDLTFPSNGGTQEVLVITSQRHPIECTTSETPPAGCTLTSIDKVTTELGGRSVNTAVASQPEPDVHPVTVTNNCDPPLEPAGAQASVAVAVVTAPRFTG